MAASQKTSKKRSAPSQAGPKAKKPHVDSAKTDKKRSRPITQPLAVEDAASDSDGPSDDVDDEGLAAEEDIAEEGGDAMEVDQKNDQRPKDPNGTAHISFEIIYCLIVVNSRPRISQSTKGAAGAAPRRKTAFDTACRR